MSHLDPAKANESVHAFLSGFEAQKQGLGRVLTLQKLQMRLNPQLAGL